MQIKHKSIITITGDLASGKSTVCNLLVETLGWELLSIGKLQREMAEKLGMDTNEFNVYMKSNPKIDDELDGKIREIGRTRERVIVDSRIAWHWIPDSLKVYLKVDIDEAAKRVLNDKKRNAETYKTFEEAKEALIKRKEIEIERLKNKYNVDYSDQKNYDLVIDTTLITPEEVCDLICNKIKKINFNNSQILFVI